VVSIESWSQQYPSWLYPGRQTLTEPETVPFPRTHYTLSWRRPDSWWRLGRRLVGRQGQPADVVVVVLATPLQVPAYLVVWLALRGAARRIVICHNVLPHEPRPFDRFLVRALFRRAEGLLVHSSSEWERARALLGNDDRTAIERAPLPPHLPGGPRSTRAPEDAARKRRLLFFGLVRPYKGLDLLLKAMVDVPSDVELVVAGEFWSGRDRYQEQIRSLGLTGRVELRPGYVPAAEIADLFASVDALVMPYRAATASQNVELAFAHGLPVVVSRAGTLADGVREGVDGLVVPENDVPALVAALRRLYEAGTLQRLRANIDARKDPSDEAWGRYTAAFEVLVEQTRELASGRR
jgi:glycosyltransferase involved in cell wall biosynthesis